MKKSSRLRKLLKVEQAKEREEARKLADCQRLLSDKRTKLTELEGYLEEYMRRFSEASRLGTSSGQVRSSHAFISQLNGGLSQQRKLVVEGENAADDQRRNWLQAKRRVEILGKTIERFVREETERDNRKEQSQSDETAQRKFHRS